VSAFAAVGILVALGHQLGTGPFLAALHGISVVAVLSAVAITATTTWFCARRWSLIADRLGVGVPTASAYRAYYRAQFLNATLPSGVVGELDRAVWHGRSARAMSRGIRSVVWDRVAGQVVLFGLAMLALPALAPPLRSWMVWSLVAAIAVIFVAHTAKPTFIKRAWAEARRVPGAPGVWPQIVLLSTLAATGHIAVFIIAARSVGIDLPVSYLVPLGLVVLQVSAIPLGVAGWGPREGGAALVFGVAGLGAGTGLAVSIAYGVLASLATMPGILMLLRRRPTELTSDPEGGPSWVIAPTRS